jgi:DNA-directed RNA polymerase specialized sigma24 family protein
MHRSGAQTNHQRLRRSGLLRSLKDDVRDDLAPGVSDAAQSDRTLMAEQIADAVQHALAKLQPQLAEALMLFEVEKKSYAEIAQMLQIVGPRRDRRW